MSRLSFEQCALSRLRRAVKIPMHRVMDNVSPKVVDNNSFCLSIREKFLYNPRVALRCPTCKKIVSIEGTTSRPFCSERCRLLDLNSWLTERYCVPVDDGIMTEHDDDNDAREHYPHT